jgi:pyruvate dehydrogenase E2 component (dihydrolipoamide acetyltransferase)
MPIDILMPALSPTMEEGVLSKWHVKIGDKLKSGDIIAEIETDKATMEIEAVDEGVVSEIIVPAETSGVKINTVIARIIGDDEGEGHAPSPAKPVPPAVQNTITPPIKATEAVSPSSVNAEPANNPIAKPTNGERLRVSPLAKRIAAQGNIDLATVKGSGPNGRIIKIDVINLKPNTQTNNQSAKAALSTEAPSVQTIEGLPYAAGSYDIQKLDGMRRTIAKRLTISARDVPHFPLQVDIEIDKLLEARKGINIQAEIMGGKVSVNDLIIKATALACKAVPAANATFTDEGILLHHNADIAVAVAVEGGLITPVIRKAETKGLLQISNEIKALAAKAKAKKLMPEEYSGGTFSVSNLGMFGIKSFSSIINQPQGCILSVGAGEPRPIVKNGQIVVATIMTVTLTCDHRVVDGSIGAEWVVAFKGFIEEPMSMML